MAIINNEPQQVDEELRQWLEDYLSAHPQHPTALLSRSQFIGVSRSALDAYVRGRYFVQQLARGLNLDAQPVTAELEDMIAQKLMRYPRVICIDQANYLNERCLGTLCHLWEKAHLPVCLIGTRDLYELFTMSRLTE